MAETISLNISAPIAGAFANVVLSLLNTLILNVQYLGRYDQYPDDRSPKLLTGTDKITYDFIIVGAGAAGCILANRLTQEPKWNVLLIEAGDYPSATSEVPIFHQTLKNSKEDWQYQTNLNNNVCQGTTMKKCTISKGKVLGGTSTINNMHYGSKLDTLANEIRMDTLNRTYLIKDELKNLYKTMNLKYMEVPLTIHNGVRFNMAKAFLSPIKNRANFFLSKNARVTKLYTKQPDYAKIQGVELMIGNKTLSIPARKEVILTTGAISTPELLLLSGIGEASLLHDLRIPLVSNVAGVGQNFHGHFGLPIFLATGGHEQQNIAATFEYIMKKQGDYADTNINEFVAFIKTTTIFHHYFMLNDLFLEYYLNSLHYHSDIVKSLKKYNTQTDIILLVLVLTDPQSRGDITINTNDNRNKDLIIKPNYFSDSDDYDLDSLIAAMESITKSSSTEYYKMLHIDIPNCRNYKFCTNHYVRCYIANMGYPMSQIGGTAQIQQGCHVSNWVVDNQLQVKGVRGIRVADESILPKPLGGNMVGTIAMIAEAASEFIKEKWIQDYVAAYNFSNHILF